MKDVFPPNLMKLSQPPIASHTDYPKEIAIIKEEEARIKGPYEGEIINGHRVAVWIPCAVDRFKRQFTPRRSRKYIQGFPKESPERSLRVFDHLVMYAESSFGKNLPYSKNDTEYYTWYLVAPEALRQAIFVRVVERLPPSYSDKEREEGTNLFL